MDKVLSRHHYPPRALAADFARSAIGLILTAGPLFLGDLIFAVRIILIVLSLVFLIYGLRTFRRRAVTIELCDQGVRATGPFAASIAWQDLKDVRLNYFSTRKDREKGWMQLHLSGNDRQLRLDDSITGFDQIVSSAIAGAVAHGISLGASTLENLDALGIRPAGLTTAQAAQAATDI
jgi:hypothetical protein